MNTYAIYLNGYWMAETKAMTAEQAISKARRNYPTRGGELTAVLQKRMPPRKERYLV